MNLKQEKNCLITREEKNAILQWFFSHMSASIKTVDIIWPENHGLCSLGGSMTRGRYKIKFWPFYFYVRRTNGRIGIPPKYQSWAKHISWLYLHCNAKKTGFSLDVCVSACLCVQKVCQWRSYEHVDRFEWKSRYMLQSASNREPPLASAIGPIFSHNLGGGSFFNFWTLISQKPSKISKNRETTAM